MTVLLSLHNVLATVVSLMKKEAYGPTGVHECMYAVVSPHCDVGIEFKPAYWKCVVGFEALDLLIFSGTQFAVRTALIFLLWF